MKSVLPAFPLHLYTRCLFSISALISGFFSSGKQKKKMPLMYYESHPYAYTVGNSLAKSDMTVL